ncbi:MAG: hypothetical protein WBM83_13645 [Flavobacteriaceae bacterium]
MQKIVKIALVVIGLIGAVLWFMLPDTDMPANEAAQSGAMNAMFWITYLLLAVAVIASFFYALKNLFSNPANLKKTLYVVGGFLVVLIISYVLSSGTDVADNYMAMSDEGTVKKIGMGLNMFFILTIVAVGAMLWGGFKKMTSK